MSNDFWWIQPGVMTQDEGFAIYQEGVGIQRDGTFRRVDPEKQTWAGELTLEDIANNPNPLYQKLWRAWHVAKLKGEI